MKKRNHPLEMAIYHSQCEFHITIESIYFLTLPLPSYFIIASGISIFIIYLLSVSTLQSPKSGEGAEEEKRRRKSRTEVVTDFDPIRRREEVRILFSETFFQTWILNDTFCLCRIIPTQSKWIQLPSFNSIQLHLFTSAFHHVNVTFLSLITPERFLHGVHFNVTVSNVKNLNILKF